MTARILVVDDIPANVKLLEARLRAEYFDVLTATNGTEALVTCEAGKIDLVLLDVMMPGMDGFEVCRRLKADPATSHVPVVMVTALDGMDDRITGLEAGADDFLTKPVSDLQLMTRVKSLVRLKSLTDELRLRATTTRNIGIEELLSRQGPEPDLNPKVLLIDDRRSSRNRLEQMLEGHARLDIAEDAQHGVFQAAEGAYDCIVVSAGLTEQDPLRLCSQLRSIDRTRFVPILLLADQGDDARITRAMELGVNDYIYRPVDRQELLARLRTQVKRKTYNDHLRLSVTRTIEMAVTDGLTGLHNRRYLDSHLDTLFERASSRHRPLSILIADIDHFKRVNDTHGHDAGDAVLKEFARRLRQNVRGIDLACRYGGEEFVIAMPDTDGETALVVAERVRAHIAGREFEITGAKLSLTTSIGVTSLRYVGDSVEALMKRADVALYDAKRGGRDRVISDIDHLHMVGQGKVTGLG